MADERVTKSDVLDALHFYKVNADSAVAMTDTATTSSNGLMSAADKAKLDGIETATQVNVIELVKVNGTPLVPDANKAVNITGAGSGGGLLPIIQITSDSSDIAVTKSGVNYPATSHVDNVHTFTVPEFGTYTVTATYELGFTRTRSINVDTVKVYTVSLAFALRYGYRIKKTEADPYARVEYLYDAVGMTPAHMDFDNGVFDYGDWGGIWFVQDNKPCMLRSNGTVDYYLNPNDYSLKEDGSPSDVANTSYDGNAMAQFPLCWVYRYEDDDYLYEIVSPAQYDENYKAYAHTDASGNIKPYFYHSLFGASGNTTKLRSLSGQTPIRNLSHTISVDAAAGNGNNWYITSWSQLQLVRTLLTLIGKSTNCQGVYGNGRGTGGAPLSTGTLITKGQFFGDQTSTNQVKVFHCERPWGDQWGHVSGILKNANNKWCVKMTPQNGGYSNNPTESGFTNTNITIPTSDDGTYINQMTCNEYGMFTTQCTGSGSTYFCDRFWNLNSGLLIPEFGGAYVDGDVTSPGFNACVIYQPASFQRSDWGTKLAYV